MTMNKAIIVGIAGKDAEIKQTTASSVANFSIATTSRYKKDEEWVEKTEWHNVVAFGKLAEFCGNWVRKGNWFCVEGSITTDKWQDKEGKDRYTTKIKADKVNFVGGKAKTEEKPASDNPFDDNLVDIDSDDTPF